MIQNLTDLELYLHADFMLLAGHEAYVRPDFHISRYPVSVRDFRELVEKAADISDEDGKFVTIGLYGMIGNVQEWCSDCDYSRETRNPICGWSSYYSNYDVMSYNIRTDFLDGKDGDREPSRFRLVFLK